MNRARWVFGSIIVAMLVWVYVGSFAWGVVALGFSFLFWVIFYDGPKQSR